MTKCPLSILITAFLLSGCVGYEFPPNIFARKPFTLLGGSEQVGRDQLANRLLVSKKLFPLEGKYSNEVLTYLGQPQQIDVIQTGISEDWLFVYYKGLQNRIDSKQDSFLVRFYQDKVIDVVRE